MPTSILYDTVTLRHFAVCNRLDILERVSSMRPSPCWVEAVHGEVYWVATRQPRPQRRHCTYILSQAWLGSPHEPQAEDLHEIFSIRTALDSGQGGNPNEHLGEAQTIYFAEMLGAIVATDDGPAYAYAERRLGEGSVVDTVGLLRIAVTSRYLTATDAAGLVSEMRAAGRALRAVHPTPLAVGDFG